MSENDYWMLLTLNLPGAEGKTRHDFNDSLQDSGWTKIPDLNTAWKKRTTEADPRKRLAGVTADIDRARDKAGIEHRIQIALAASAGPIHHPKL